MITTPGAARDRGTGRTAAPASGTGLTNARAAFGFGLYGFERRAHGGLPCGSDPVCPQLTSGAEVGAELTGVVKPGLSVVLGEREFLGYLRHWAADQPEPNPPWPVERDRLQRRGGGPAAAHRRGGLRPDPVRPPPKAPGLPRHPPPRPPPPSPRHTPPR